MPKYIKQKNNSGFSLVEMLVAVGIFMSIMTIAISSLISIINANKKAQAIKSTIDSVTFAMDEISRDMRSGTDYKCSINGGLEFINDTETCSKGGNAVRYTSNSGTGKIITYVFNGTSSDPLKGILTKQIDTDSFIDLISQDSGVNITDMKFYVMGADHESDINITTRTQPRVIITASGLVPVKGGNDTSFNLQTSISQRSRK